jgi:hypothetical protein
MMPIPRAATCYLPGRRDESMMPNEKPRLGDHSEAGQNLLSTKLSHQPGLTRAGHNDE